MLKIGRGFGLAHSAGRSMLKETAVNMEVNESVSFGTGSSMGATIDGVKYNFAGMSKDSKKLYTAELDNSSRLVPAAYLDGTKLVGKFYIYPLSLAKIQRSHRFTTSEEVMNKYGVK